MRAILNHLGIVVALGAAAPAIAASAGDAPPVPCSYSVLQVQPWSCGNFMPESPTPLHLNNHGHWVGYVYSCTSATAFPIKWAPETGMVALPLPPGITGGAATGVNDAGLIVGNAGPYAAAWPPEGGCVLLKIVTPEATSGASAVNNAGMIAGVNRVGDRWHAFVLDGERVVDINPEDHGYAGISVTDVSEAGHVAGYVSPFGNWQYERGFRWKDGAMEILHPLPGALACRVWGVNSQGVAVGDSKFYEEDGVTYSHYRPTAWIGGEASPLALAPTYSAGVARDVSDDGVILGSVSTPNQSGIPPVVRVVWLGRGAPQPIIPLLEMPQWGGLGIPYAINDSGEIVTTGGTPPMGFPSSVYEGVWILTPHFVMGDVTHDCTVDGADLAALLEAWGPVRRESEPADLDGDGRVGGADLGAMLAAWSMD